MILDIAFDQLGRQTTLDHFVDNEVANGSVVDARRMLSGNDDGIDPNRFVAIILDGYLALAIGPEPFDVAVLARPGEGVDDVVREGDG